LPLLEDAIAIYYSLMPAEVSTNLARFDGIRFGVQDDTTKYPDISEYYKKVRSE
jgi:aspartyl-tRNA(Asn)/glutamyl-tRNA(Gln) amidotransferase subunit A